jgi:hypothetical protein
MTKWNRPYNASMGAGAHRFLLRWAAAFVGICCGWLFELMALLCLSHKAVYALIDAERISLYFVAAWLLFGFPLAVWGPRLSSAGRIVLGCFMCGWLSALIPALILGIGSNLGVGLEILHMIFLPVGRYFRVWLLSFPPAAISILVYALVVRGIARAEKQGI